MYCIIRASHVCYTGLAAPHLHSIFLRNLVPISVYPTSFLSRITNKLRYRPTFLRLWNTVLNFKRCFPRTRNIKERLTLSSKKLFRNLALIPREASIALSNLSELFQSWISLRVPLLRSRPLKRARLQVGTLYHSVWRCRSQLIARIILHLQFT